MWPPFLQQVQHVTLHGMDPNDKAVSEARANLPQFRENIQVGRGEELDELFPQKFDVIVSRAVLEHVYRRPRFVASICAALKDDGVLILTYGSQHFKEGFRANVRNLTSQLLAFAGIDRYYAKRVDEAEFERILTQNQMRIAEKKYLSLTQVKMAQKLIAQGSQRDQCTLLWLELEERLNQGAIDKETLRELTDETYFEVRHASS